MMKKDSDSDGWDQITKKRGERKRENRRKEPN